MTKSTGRKTIDSYIKHEDIVDKAVDLGKAHGLDVAPTEGNDPRGDIRVREEDLLAYLEIMGKTIDSNQQKREAE